MAQVEVNLQKKVSVSKLSGKTTVKRVVDAAGNVLQCGQFMGRATGIITGDSDYGPWTGLLGQFRAISPKGETFDSAQCFLPDVAQNLIIGQLQGGAQAVDFAFNITAILDEESPVGFSYRAAPLLDVSADDPIARIQQRMEVKRLSLAGESNGKTVDPETGEIKEETKKKK